MTTNKILQEFGTQLLFADHATDFGAAPATAANSLIIGSPTDVQMNLSVLADAAYWQSAKTASGDMDDTVTHRPQLWVFGACFEHTATPAAGTNMVLWWNPSTNTTDGTGNSGGASGADATYTAAGTKQLMHIGTMILRNNVINVQNNIGTIWIPTPDGSLIVQNNSGVAMVADGDADEIHIVATPTIVHIEAAA